LNLKLDCFKELNLEKKIDLVKNLLLETIKTTYSKLRLYVYEWNDIIFSPYYHFI